MHPLHDVRGQRRGRRDPARRFRYRRYFCKWLATFSLVIPSTFMSCKMVFGTAFLIPRWFTAFMKRMWSSGVHTSRGFFGCLPPPPPPPPWTSSVGRGVAVGLVTFGVVVVPGRNLGYREEESGGEFPEVGDIFS